MATAVISWIVAGNTTGHDIKIVKNGIETMASVGAAANSYNVTLSPGDTLTAQVRGKNSAGAGEWSDPIPAVVVPALPVPEKVTGVSITLY